MRRRTARIAALAACAWLAGPAAAEVEGPLPALHDVTGVAAGDVLNLRAGPDPDADLVGMLAPDARDIEVVELGRAPSGAAWALVARPEGGAWAAARFLARQDVQDGTGWLPPINCTGTEPFWSFELGTGEIAALRMPDSEAAPVFVTRRTVSANDPRGHGVTARWDGPEGDPATFGITGAPVTALIRRAACSDGMSDRPYGLAIDLLAGTLGPDGRSETAHLSGCCRLAAPR